MTDMKESLTFFSSQEEIVDLITLALEKFQWQSLEISFFIKVPHGGSSLLFFYLRHVIQCIQKSSFNFPDRKDATRRTTQ